MNQVYLVRFQANNVAYYAELSHDDLLTLRGNNIEATIIEQFQTDQQASGFLWRLGTK